MRRILVTGKNGQVGWELQGSLASLGEVVALGSNELDLAKPDSIIATLRTIKPDVIVNAAAYTAVDKAEDEPERAVAVNATGPGILAEEAKRLGAKLVHYSTDYVFDGTKRSPYTEQDSPNPTNCYGRSKLAGERAIASAGVGHIILRTSWVYAARGKNFLLTMLRAAATRPELRVVNDQLGTPNWSRTIARTTAAILARALAPDARAGFAERDSVYHLSASGSTSWHGFARAIFEEAGALHGDPMPLVQPISSAEYPTRAARPQNSVLANDRISAAFDLSLPDWRADVRDCVRELRARSSPPASLGAGGQ